MANLAVLGTLARRNDYVYEDRLNHASLIDAARLAGVHLRRYRHGCTAHLAALLSATESAGDSFIVSDAIFSMDGDNAPLADLAELARKHDSWLVVDDAHGLGVNGAEGRGTLAEQGLTLGDVPVLVGTLGKAFGTFGAFVAGSDDLIETLIQRARPYIYTTALPPAVAHASIAAIEIARREEWRRERLRELAARLRRGAIQLGLDLPPTSPILPLIVGDAARAVALSSALWARGIIIKAIRPPTVPEGTSRLRITLSAAHSDAHIDRLLTALDEVL
jgi:8-amino-7-oxononanoate synthase